jgi:hypothetical protein
MGRVGGARVSHKILSPEFWAAGFGAMAAFGLEALRRYQVERRRELMAGNEAIFVLAQYANILRAIHGQKFVDAAPVLREKLRREPIYVDFQPVEATWNPSMRIPFGRLGFLLRTHDADLINRLGGAERDSLGLLRLLDRRNAQHLEFQRRAAIRVLPNAEAAQPLAAVEEAVGLDIARQLRQSTEDLQKLLPATIETVETRARELTNVLRYEFLFSRPVKLEVKDSVPPSEQERRPRAPIWRRAVRAVVDFWRSLWKRVL